MSKKRSALKIGKLGEKTLSKWATEADLIINRSDEDESGWDFVVEFPLDSEQPQTRTSLDKRIAPIQCLVQVKSTDSRTGKRDIKLSNWERLVKSPLPAFFLVCEFDGLNECQRAFLIHIDERLIRRVLKRLREADAAQSRPIHQIKSTLTYKEMHCIYPMNGNGLRATIVAHVGPSFNDYVVKKQKYVEEVGYENGGHIGEFTMTVQPGEDPLQILVDHSMGLRGPLTVEKIRFTDLRFGTEAVGLRKEWPGGEVEFLRNESEIAATLALELAEGTEIVKFPVKVIGPSGFAFELDKKYQKLRLSAPYLDFILSAPTKRQNKVSISFKVPWGETVPLFDLRPMSDLVWICWQAKSTTSIIRLHLQTVDGKSFSMAMRDPSDSMFESEELRKLVLAVRMGWQITRRFDVDETLMVQPDELLDCFEKLQIYASTLDAANFKVKLPPSAVETSQFSRVYVPIVNSLWLGQYELVLAFTVSGEVDLEREYADGHELVDVRHTIARVCHVRAYDRHKDNSAAKQSLFNAMVQQHEGQSQLVILKDINDHFVQ